VQLPLLEQLLQLLGQQQQRQQQEELGLQERLLHQRPGSSQML